MITVMMSRAIPLSTMTVFDMKKVLLLPAALVLAVAACNKNDSDEVSRTVFTITPFTAIDEEGPMTKTSFVEGQEGTTFIWSEADTVGIYPSSGAQVYFAMASGAGASSATFDGGGWGFKTSATYYSYYPFIGDIYLDRNRIPVSFTGQMQPTTASIGHIGPYDYMYTPGATYDGSGALSFTYKHLCCIIRCTVTLPAGTWTKLAITAPSSAFATKGYFDLEAAAPHIVPTSTSSQLQIAMDNITLTASTQFRIFLVSAPVNLQGVEITVSALNDQRKEYQCKKTPSRNYEAGGIYGLSCATWMEIPQSMGLIMEDWEDGGTIGGGAD